MKNDKTQLNKVQNVFEEYHHDHDFASAGKAATISIEYNPVEIL